MIREKRRKKKKRKIFALSLLTIILILAVAALIIVKVFTVEEVIVTGNERYDDEQIRETVLNDAYSWNTLYVYLKYRFQKPEAVPFIDTMEITMEIPHTIRIHVYEKGLIGAVTLPETGEYAYFDKDGIVVEISAEKTAGIPDVEGIDVSDLALYQELPISDQVRKNLLSLTQSLKKYEIVPDVITCGSDKTYELTYGTIRVKLGKADSFREKILRLKEIFPKLDGMSGTLHLESWSGEKSDITFEKTG